MRGCITRSFSKAVGHFSRYVMGSGFMAEVGTVECKAGKKADAKKLMKLANAKWPNYVGTLICTSIEMVEEKRYMTEETFIANSLPLESSDDEEAEEEAEEEEE